jgi:hypothetical protein
MSCCSTIRLVSARLLLVELVIAYDCVFIPDMHFKNEGDKGPYPSEPAESKEICCDLCSEQDSCHAGIWTPAGKASGTSNKDLPATCWFKNAAAVKPANEVKLKDNTACVPGEYATAADRALGTEADDGVQSHSGLILALLLLGIMGAYGGGGLAVGHCQGRRQNGGELIDLHPHAQALRNLKGLVHDGVQGLVLGGRRGDGDRGGSERRASLIGTKSAKSAKSSSKSKKSSGDKSKKGSSSKETGDSSSGKSKSRAEATPPPPLAEPEPAAREWQPTRTGHLAVGARETGVKVQL